MTAAPTVFRAQTVIAMEPNTTRASAVLVARHRIVAVGKFDDLRDCVVDEAF